MIQNIIKRDGRMVLFDIDKIADAIYKSFTATETTMGRDDAMKVAEIIVHKLEERHADLPTVELVQDTVEETLIEKGYARTAKAYILYRAEHARSRNQEV